MIMHFARIRAALKMAAREFPDGIRGCNAMIDGLAALRALEADVEAKNKSSWWPMSSAPTDRSIMLAVKGTPIPIYCGQLRYGTMGEPQQDILAWRCDSSGRFANPTHWMPLPEKP